MGSTYQAKWGKQVLSRKIYIAALPPCMDMKLSGPLILSRLHGPSSAAFTAAVGASLVKPVEEAPRAGALPASIVDRPWRLSGWGRTETPETPAMPSPKGWVGGFGNFDHL